MDTKYLLNKNFEHVIALDADVASQEKSKEIVSNRFSFQMITFMEYNFIPDTFDLINAQLSLPYMAPADFDVIFKKVKQSLKKGGIFTGQLFGDRDEDILVGEAMTRLTFTQIKELFMDMNIIKLQEREEDKESTLGKLKHFHKIEFIVRK